MILSLYQDKNEKNQHSKKKGNRLMSSKKQVFGQFMTKNSQYILKGMEIPMEAVHIIEPFCGEGDLILFIPHKEERKIECYDIDPSPKFNKGVVQQDTLKNPPSYRDKFIITNPPFLARNKSKNKDIFDKYDTNDLYKCFIKILCSEEYGLCYGGIVILPLNFWSSIRKADIELRKLFLSMYKVVLINIFEEKVFDDTTYAICSFQFEKGNGNNIPIRVIVYPSEIEILATLTEANNFLIGGDIFNLEINNSYSISRLTKKNNVKNTRILANA